MEVGRPKFMPVLDIEMVGKKQDLISRMKAEVALLNFPRCLWLLCQKKAHFVAFLVKREQSVQIMMDHFLKVITIPGIDNHGAHAAIIIEKEKGKKEYQLREEQK
ncbi:hypothetical protein RJ641_029909, partial [Dillenia turbinata]